MRCLICKQTDEETNILKGIYDGRVVFVCERCAEIENIPLIKKPSEDQLRIAETRQSVRERMEKMSGLARKRALTSEQIITHKNLAKLRIPAKKQEHPKLVENYYWKIQLARRKKKISINQVFEKTGIDKDILIELEKGVLPNEFEKIIAKLEVFFGIILLKKIVEWNKPEKEGMIINVDEKLKEKKQEKLRSILKGEVDFSKRNDLNDITLSDLVDLKRKKEMGGMFGTDIELDGY